jgi:hypothetical protein
MSFNTSKATIAFTALICVTLLLMTDSISSDGGFGLLGTIIGYAVGNGIAAKTGITADPIIRPKPKTDTE